MSGPAVPTIARPRASREEFTTLLEAVLPRAYAVALHYTRDPSDAEDILQEAAMLAFRGFSTFQSGTNFKAWFLKILTNAFLMRCRREKRRNADVPLDEMPDLVLYAKTVEGGLFPASADPAAEFFDRIDAEKVAAAIASLPTPFRAVATLYFVEDLPYAEIAELLSIPVGTVRSRLHRARATLQRELWRVAVDRGLLPSLTAEPVLASPAF